jgi:hypothetical protein
MFLVGIPRLWHQETPVQWRTGVSCAFDVEMVIGYSTVNSATIPRTTCGTPSGTSTKQTAV